MPDAPLAALLVVLVLLVSAVLVMVAHRDRRGGDRSEVAHAEGDRAIREARALRAESRETRMRIEANANAAGRPTEEDWLKSLGLTEKRSRDDR